MLSAALLNVADRLITTLMTLVDAIYPIALADGTPTFPEHAAHTLYLRLSNVIATLIRISAFGIRAAAKSAPTPARLPPDPIAQRPPPSPAPRLPNHPGWLLAALPDSAPAIASDLAALLADPALATLLATAPTLQRALRPLLRGLGLAQSSPPTDRGPPTSSPPLPSPTIPPRPHPAPASTPSLRPKSTRLHEAFLTTTLLR